MWQHVAVGGCRWLRGNWAPFAVAAGAMRRQRQATVAGSSVVQALPGTGICYCSGPGGGRERKDFFHDKNKPFLNTLTTYFLVNFYRHFGIKRFRKNRHVELH